MRLRAMNAWGRAAAGAVVCAVAGVAAAQPMATEVTFEGVGGLELRGTLVVPEGEVGAKHAAVLLLPGSGPTDRDGNQKPLLTTDLLKQIAERLAAEGVASLRFDKRAVAVYRESWPATVEELNGFFGWEEFVGDAGAAYRFLRERGEVDGSRVMIAGHSEGALLALQLGHDLGEDERPAGLILMAAAGRTLDVVLREQIENTLRLQGADEAVMEMYLPALDGAIAAVKAREPVPADLPPGLAPLFNPTALDLLHSYFTVDPAELAKAYPGPVLIVQGREDAQVSAERDTPRLEGALRAREEGAVEVEVVEGASHNLKEAGGGPMSEFAGPVVEGAMGAVVRWVKARG